MRTHEIDEKVLSSSVDAKAMETYGFLFFDGHGDSILHTKSARDENNSGQERYRNYVARDKD